MKYSPEQRRAHLAQKIFRARLEEVRNIKEERGWLPLEAAENVAGPDDTFETVVNNLRAYYIGKAADSVGLDETQRLILYWHYYEDMSMVEIGKELDLLEDRVRSRRDLALRKLHSPKRNPFNNRLFDLLPETKVSE